MTESAATTQACAPSSGEQWARLAADVHAEIAILHAGNDDPEHRSKVRAAHERALAKGSDFL
jgi:hypothetical protein